MANYLTALKKEQHKKDIEFTLKEKKEQQWLCNHVCRAKNGKENALLTARLKLACGGGGSVYQGKIQCKLPQQCEHTSQQVFIRTPRNAVNALVTSKKILDNCFFITNICLLGVREIVRKHQGVIKTSINTIDWIIPDQSARHFSESLLDSWRETGQHNFGVIVLDIGYTPALPPRPHPPARTTSAQAKTKTQTDPPQPPSTFLPPQLTNTGGFSLFYCKNTTGNSILKLRWFTWQCLTV